MDIRLKGTGSLLLLALCTASINSRADEPPGLSTEAMAELQRLADDPQTQRANAAWILASQQIIQQHLRAVAANGDARSLLAAAMLWSASSTMADDKAATSHKLAQETRAWFDAARRARPRDVLVAWIEASNCGNLTDTCNPKDALKFLLEAEPDNAAVQLLALADAEKRGDRKAMELHWQAAASASTYDAHMLEIGQLLHGTMQGVDYPPFDSRLSAAMGLWLGLNRPATPRDFSDVGVIALTVALALPQFTPVVRNCELKSLATSSALRRNECERVLELLAKDESAAITPMVALPRLIALAGDTAQGKAWREKLRQFYWVYENAAMQLAGLTLGGPLPADYGTWFMTEGEMVAMRKLIVGHGLPADAPAGWLPSQPRNRALVSTGKEPLLTQ